MAIINILLVSRPLVQHKLTQEEGDYWLLFIQLASLFDFLNALLEHLDFVMQDYGICLARLKGLQPLKCPSITLVAQLMYLAWQLSDTVPPTTLKVHSVINNQKIKIWWGTLKIDVGRGVWRETRNKLMMAY